MKEYVKKYKVKSFFSYSEFSKNNITYCGWIKSDVPSDCPVIITSPSSSKKFSESERSLAKADGVMAASVEDYKKMFVAISGRDYVQYKDMWDNSPDDWKRIWMKEGRPNDKEQHAFVYNLFRLIEYGEKFSMYGKIYKKIIK